MCITTITTITMITIITIIIISIMRGMVLLRLRSVFIISNRKISNWAPQILKTSMLLMCPYCLKFQIVRV